MGTYEKFTDTYLSYPVNICKVYEVRRERKPVRLYLSIYIPDCDGVAVNDSSLVDILIRYVNHCLHVNYKRHIPYDQVLRLDSSTASNFSQQLICPGVIFHNNEECRLFVKMMIDAAKAAVEGKQLNQLTQDFPIDQLRQLFVGKKFVADETVYENVPDKRRTMWSKVDSPKDFCSKEYLGEGLCSLQV